LILIKMVYVWDDEDTGKNDQERHKPKLRAEKFL